MDSQPIEGGAVLNLTATSLLGLLHDAGEMTGGELLRVAQTRIGAYWNLTRSQVYRELTALAEQGYVEEGTAGARDSRPFRITAAGVRGFRESLAGQTPTNQVRIGLLVMLAFGRQLPKGRLASLLDDFEAHHRARLAEYRELDAHLADAGEDPYVRATLAFGLHYEEAVLRWLDALPSDVRRGTARPPEGG